MAIPSMLSVLAVAQAMQPDIYMLRRADKWIMGGAEPKRFSVRGAGTATG